jgi:hypothetical protein
MLAAFAGCASSISRFRRSYTLIVMAIMIR